MEKEMEEHKEDTQRKAKIIFSILRKFFFNSSTQLYFTTNDGNIILSQWKGGKFDSSY